MKKLGKPAASPAAILTQPLNVRLPTSLMDAVKQAAKRDGVTVTHIIRAALEREIAFRADVRPEPAPMSLVALDGRLQQVLDRQESILTYHSGIAEDLLAGVAQRESMTLALDAISHALGVPVPPARAAR